MPTAATHLPTCPRLTRDEIAVKVRTILADHLGGDPNDMPDSLNIIEDLDADSLDTTQLTLTYEDEFGIHGISAGDASKLTTVGAVVEYLERRLLTRERRPPTG